MNIYTIITVIYGSLFSISMISSMFNTDIVKNMYSDYYKKIDKKERENLTWSRKN